MSARAGLLMALALLSAGRAFAASNSGTTALPLLHLQQGARPTGMGGAFTALADDVNAIWWNPAGLARSKMTEVTFSHTAFVEDVKTEYLAVSRPIEMLKGTVATSLTYMSVPGIEGFDATGKSVGNLTANSYAVSVGYAGVIGQLAWGVAGKQVGQTLTTEKGSGIAADFGFQYQQERLGVGMALQNMGPAFKIGNDTKPLPTTVRFGAAYAVHPRVKAALDISKARDGDAVPHLGGEARLTESFHLRAGWQKQENLGSGAGLSFGFTLLGVVGKSQAGAGGDWGGDGTPWWEKAATQYAGLVGSIDYSFLSLGNLNDVHRLSLSLKF